MDDPMPAWGLHPDALGCRSRPTSSVKATEKSAKSEVIDTHMSLRFPVQREVMLMSPDERVQEVGWQ